MKKDYFLNVKENVYNQNNARVDSLGRNHYLKSIRSASIKYTPRGNCFYKMYDLS